MGVCSNELECVAFALSRNFTRGRPLERGRCAYFLRKPSPVRSECLCRFRLRTGKRRGRQTQTPTHTHRQFELYILDHCIVNFGVHGVITALATSQGSRQAC